MWNVMNSLLAVACKLPAQSDGSDHINAISAASANKNKNKRQNKNNKHANFATKLAVACNMWLPQEVYFFQLNMYASI